MKTTSNIKGQKCNLVLYLMLTL